MDSGSSSNADIQENRKEIAQNDVLEGVYNKWDVINGWGIPFDASYPIYFRNWGRKSRAQSWEFNGASLDQGLFLQHFILFPHYHSNNGVMMGAKASIVICVDTLSVHLHMLKSGGSGGKEVSFTSTPAKFNEVGVEVIATEADTKDGLPNALLRSQFVPSVTKFIHFTGRSKPWILIQKLFNQYYSDNASTNPNTKDSEVKISFDDLMTLHKKQVQSRSKKKVKIGLGLGDISVVTSWLKELDELNISYVNAQHERIEVNSNNIIAFSTFGSSLGYFASNV